MKTRVVILGGGFGGAYCAQALGRSVRKGYFDVTLIDRHNYFPFYPLLVEAGTGSLNPRHAVISIRALTGPCTFLMAEIIGVDIAKREVHYEVPEADLRESVRYDQLVISLGSVTRQPDIPGLKKHGYQIKGLGDAVALRDRAIRLLEAANATADPEKRRALLHFVVVGGNFTGAEVAGEFHVFLRDAARQYPSLSPHDCRVTLLEIADRILPALDVQLSNYALSKMRARGIDIRLQSSVRIIDLESILLDSGERLATHTTIWCAGIAPPPLMSVLPLQTDKLGYVLCEPDFRASGAENIWAIGDCAVNPDPRGKPYPPTAQHASRQGIHLARNLARVARSEAPLPFVYASHGAFAALGCRTGVAKVFGVKLSGFPAWFLWRTVYLLKMPGFARKVRVALDWTLDLLFRPDFVQLGVHRPSPPIPEGASPTDPSARDRDRVRLEFLVNDKRDRPRQRGR